MAGGGTAGATDPRGVAAGSPVTDSARHQLDFDGFPGEDAWSGRTPPDLPRAFLALHHSRRPGRRFMLAQNSIPRRTFLARAVALGAAGGACLVNPLGVLAADKTR